MQRKNQIPLGSRGETEPKRISTIFDNIVNQELTAWASRLKQLRDEHRNEEGVHYEE